MTISVLKIIPLLQAFSCAIFCICGASHGSSASEELLVVFSIVNNTVIHFHIEYCKKVLHHFLLLLLTTAVEMLSSTHVNTMYVGVLKVEVVRLQYTQLLYDIVKQHLSHALHLYNDKTHFDNDAEQTMLAAVHRISNRVFGIRDRRK